METREAGTGITQETTVNVVTAMTLKEATRQAQEQEDWEMQQLMEKIKSAEFQSDLIEIIKEQGPGITMPQAIDIYVDNNA